MDSITKKIIYQLLNEFISWMLRSLGIIGIVLAVLLSWQENQSIFLSIFHGFCGWMYIFWHFDYRILFSIVTSTLLTTIVISYTIMHKEYVMGKNVLDKIKSALNDLEKK